MENASFGSPKIFQDLIKAGSPSISRSWKSEVQITSKLVHRSTHRIICWIRKGIVKGPKYATTPEAIIISPINRWYLRNDKLVITHLTRNIYVLYMNFTFLPKLLRFHTNAYILPLILQLNPQHVLILFRNPPLSRTYHEKLLSFLPKDFPIFLIFPIHTNVSF